MKETNRTEKLIRELKSFTWHLDRSETFNPSKGEINHYFGKAIKEIEELDKLVSYWKNKYEMLSMRDVKFIRSENNERICKGCNRDISHKHPNAKFHSKQCKDEYWNLVNPRGYGLNDNYGEGNPKQE